MATDYLCPHCENPEAIPPSEPSCPACRQGLPPPNVRAATDDEEVESLQERLERAEIETSARHCKHILDDFGDQASVSQAVICRPLGHIKEIVSSNALYSTYYAQLRANTRLPADSFYDNRRGTVDSMFFPNYHEHIVFAALSLNHRGLSAYGPHSLELKDQMISHRATVFESNTVTFVRAHKLEATSPIPLGYRASWENRGKLAKAKLHAKLDAQTTKLDYPEILIDNEGETDSPDFIEVHIYQGFSRRAINRVTFAKKTKRPDNIIINSIKKKLNELSIPCEDS